MGTYTFYLTTRNNAEEYIIDWDSMNTEVIFKFRPLESAYKEKTTLQEVAEEFNESKLFGYMSWDLTDALFEFNRHIKPIINNTNPPPILYFTWEGANWLYALEFFPGKEKIHILRYDFEHLLSKDWTWEEYSKVTNSLPDQDGWECEVL